MTKQPRNSKNCSLCGTPQPLKHFLSVTRKNKTFYGTVCLNCLGNTQGRLFDRKSKDKLQFDPADFFYAFDKGDDDDGSGGWDPEDRAKDIKKTLAIDARARDAFFKKRKQKTEDIKQEYKLHLEEIEDEASKTHKKDVLHEEAKDSLDRLASRSTTLSKSSRSKKYQIGKSPTKSTVKYTLTKNIQRQESSKILSSGNTQKATSGKVTHTKQTQDNSHQKTELATDNTKPDPKIAATKESLTQQSTTNEFISNSYQRLGQTFAFLSPFSREGTNIRNKFTGGSPDRLNNLFANRRSVENRHKQDDAIKQELNESDSKDLYEQAKAIFKK